MSLTAAVLRELARAGLNAEQLVEAAERIEEAGRPRTSTERVRAYRERQEEEKRETRNVKRVTVTSPPETKVSPGPLSKTQTPLKETLTGFQKGTQNNRGLRLPENFEPSISDAIVCGLDRNAAAAEIPKFRDYWRAAPGQRGVKRDWPATWRNWCRKASEDRSRSTGHPKTNGNGLRHEEATWSERLAAARKRALWPVEWGPVPGEVGCQVPSDLLRPTDGQDWIKSTDGKGWEIQYEH